MCEVKPFELPNILSFIRAGDLNGIRSVVNAAAERARLKQLSYRRKLLRCYHKLLFDWATLMPKWHADRLRYARQTYKQLKQGREVNLVNLYFCTRKDLSVFLEEKPLTLGEKPRATPYPQIPSVPHITADAKGNTLPVVIKRRRRHYARTILDFLCFRVALGPLAPHRAAIAVSLFLRCEKQHAIKVLQHLQATQVTSVVSGYLKLTKSAEQPTLDVLCSGEVATA